jgi:hypothetical protein
MPRELLAYCSDYDFASAFPQPLAVDIVEEDRRVKK